MAKKSWFSLLKRLFIAETHSRRRWGFGRKRVASVSAPSLSLSRESPLGKAEEEQSKHAVTVAAAAAEVVRLTGIPQSAHQYQKIQEFSDINIQANTNQSTQQYERGIPDLAATKIQTAFRGYLARKALRALKGVVRLQAIIRGRAVRRQATTTLRCLQSIVSIQSQVCAKKLQMVEGTWNNFHENKELQGFKDKIDSNSQRRWDDSMLSKDEANDMFLNKREAAVKRERIKEYSLSHRRSTESEHNKVNGRRRNWLEQWVDTQLSKNSDTVFPSNARIREQYGGQFKPRNSQKQYHIEGVDPPISSVHQRRSFHHKKQCSVGDDNGFASSSIVPTYMAATESAKAKARSMSSPRLRGVSLDAYSDTNSPYKHRLSLISSIYSEMTSSSRTYNLDVSQQRSLCLKSLPGSLK